MGLGWAWAPGAGTTACVHRVKVFGSRGQNCLLTSPPRSRGANPHPLGPSQTDFRQVPLPKTQAWGKRESGSWTSCGRPEYGAGACAMCPGRGTSDPHYSRSWWLSQLRLLSAHGTSHGVACSASPTTLKASKTLVNLILPITTLIREADSREVRKRLSAKALPCRRQKEDRSAGQASKTLVLSSLSSGTNYFCSTLCCNADHLSHQVSFVPLKCFDQGGCLIVLLPAAVLTSRTMRDPGKCREVRREKEKTLLRRVNVI